MLIAREIPQGYSRAFKIAVFIQAGVFLFIGMGFGLFGHMLNVNANVDGFVIMGVATTLAALLAVIALWLKPPVFAGLNLIAMILAVLVTTSFVLPRFEKSDTMRPWTTVLPKLVSDDQTVFLYRPSRWMEYGMQFYRFNKTRGVYSPEELMSVLGSTSLFFLADEKALADLGEIAGIEVRIMETVGNQTALWVQQSR
jgi:hypothetical protein